MEGERSIHFVREARSAELLRTEALEMVPSAQEETLMTQPPSWTCSPLTSISFHS